jgi:hypothetical protein
MRMNLASTNNRISLTCTAFSRYGCSETRTPGISFSARPLALGGLLAAFLCLLPPLTRAETAFQAWVQRYNGLANGYDGATAVAVDRSNDVIVTGTSTGSGSGYDYATIKYSSGGVPLSTNLYNGPGNSNDATGALAVDRSNNVIVTGYSAGSGSGDDYATIKYSSAGIALWTNRYNGPGNENDSPYAVAVDRSNNVVVTGVSIGSGSGYDYATIKYSSEGEPLWTNRYNGPGNGYDYAFAVDVDGGNNVIVTGVATNSAGNWDYATIKYSTEGLPLWTNLYDGPVNGSDVAYAVAVDGSNSVIVTGYSTGSGSGSDYATIKYSSAGEPLWTNRYNGPGNGYDVATAVAADGSDNVIVTGESSGSGSGSDYATIEYSSAGEPVWTNRYSGQGTGSDRAYAVAVDGSNNVIVTGGLNAREVNSDYATIKYSSAGLPLWTNLYNGPGNGRDVAYALAVDSSNNAIVAGPSRGIGSGSDFATVKYATPWPPVLNALSVTNSSFQLRVDDVLQPGTLVIEASSNLTGWLPIFTNTTPTNVLFYSDPGAANYPWRFYRAFQFP